MLKCGEKNNSNYAFGKIDKNAQKKSINKIQSNFCSACGTKIAEHENYCYKCGSPV